MSGKTELEPRDYQLELFDAALKDNIIACLGTGTGKTFIGVMLIKELSHQIRVSFEEGGKRTIFLVPTVPLVEQQKNVIQEHTDLTVDGFFGDMGVDLFSQEEWVKHFSKNNVLVMVAEVFKNVLVHGFVSLAKINLIIFDECHRAVKNHPYREIMKVFEYNKPPYPRIMGLTASVINGKCKANKLKEHILNLELTLKSKAIVASDMTSISRFGTKPKEMLYYYRVEDEQLLNSSTSDIEGLLLASQKQIDMAKSDMADFKLEAEIDNADMFHPYRDCKQFISDIVEVLKTMGVWCAYRLVDRYLTELTKTLEKNDNDAVRRTCNIVRGSLETVKNKMKKIMGNSCNPQELVLKDVSHKLQRLLALLQCKNPSLSENRDSEPLCGIVFVEKRITAYILSLWLQEVARYRGYNYLKVNFVVGHGMSQGIDNKQAFTSKKQNEILELFRKKKINLLIASSVIEEGMDIPRCNFVIRYDPPNDYRSFIQSKGRARAAQSFYVIMLPNEKGKERIFIEDLVNYKTIETILLNICQSREVPDELCSKEHLSDKDEPPYKPFDSESSPMIPLTSAINIVYRYCNMLPIDSFTKCKPRTQFSEIPVEGSSTPQYKCEIKMPLNSVIKEWVVGKPMRSKTLAKMSAALEVCRLLHKSGELDDVHLLPKKYKLLTEENETIDTVDSNNKTNCYIKAISPCIYGLPPKANSQCYVYTIHMTLEKLKPGSEMSPEYLKLDPKSSLHFYALILSNPLPELCSFTVFNMAGKIKVQLIRHTEKLNLNFERREILTKFQECTFTEVLKLYEQLVYFDINKPGYAFFIGAVLKDKESFTLDWDFMTKTYQQFEKNKAVNLKELLRNLGNLQSINDPYKFSLNPAADFEDAVVFPVHVNSNLQPMYIYEIGKENIKSTFIKNTYPTYEQYFAKEYGLCNLNPNYPMLQCFYCDKAWLAVPQYLNRDRIVTSLRNKYDKRFWLPVEVCEIQGTSASMRKLATCLPVIIYRLNSLLLSRDLIMKVSDETGISQNLDSLHLDNVNFDWIECEQVTKTNEPKKFKLYAYGELVNAEEDNNAAYDSAESHAISNQKKKFNDELKYFIPQIDLDCHSSNAPTMSLVLEAITALNAGDFINLERLETVGDAFLKFAASHYAFYANPNFHEGLLTTLKMRQISNSKLCKLGKRLKLHEILTYSKFDPANTFLPPGFCVLNGLENAFVNFKPESRNLFLYGNIAELMTLNITEISSKLKEDNETSKIKKDVKGEELSHVSVSLRTMQYLRDKNIADLVEALIGAYVISCGTKGTLLFMSWLGLEVLPKRDSEEEQNLLRNGSPPMVARFKDIPLPPTALLHNNELSRKRMYNLLSGFSELEKNIGYVFTDKSYLLQAFTHTSYNGFHVTDCYQRLEFLGDAVLDHVITRHLYEDPKNFQPGDLSDFRQALVNNTFFGMLATKYSLHKFLKYAAPSLLKVIDNFVKKVREMPNKDLLETLPNMIGEFDCEVAEEIEVPKVLGDIIESLAGAIYLDSGYSFNAVWKVFKKMMADEIQHYRNKIPKSPIRQLMEAYPCGVEFQNVGTAGQKTAIKVRVDKQVFCGYGLNKKMAKNAAAKLALRKLKFQQNY